MELFRRKTYSLIGLMCIIIISSSCSNSKYIPAGDKLYTGARVGVRGAKLTSKQRKVLRTDLEGLTRPRPNSKILGARVKLWANHIPFLRKKFAEPPVLLSDVKLQYNADLLANHLQNTGYFGARVRADTVVKGKKARAVYRTRPGPQYMIKEVVFETDSSDALESNISAAAAKSLLRPGKPFNLEAIIAERRRIDAYLKERGFFFFSPDNIIVQTDTTVGDNQVNLYVKLKETTPAAARDIYHINNVYVYSNYSLNTATIDTNQAHARFYKGFYVVDKDRLHKPLLFEHALQFRPDDVYNRNDHNISLNRLINLGVFKFVKNRFEDIPSVDTPKLDAYYYLTPFPKKALRLELTGHTKSNNLTGSQVTLSWRNRNTFRGGELFTVNASIGSEYQYSGLSQAYNTYRFSIQPTLQWPRFVIPFFDVRVERSPFLPRTNLEGEYEIINRRSLYTLNSFRLALGYLWKESMTKEHQFYPVSINYVQPSNVTELYDSAMKTNPTLAKAIEKQYILGTYYIYNINQLTNTPPPNAIYFNGLIDFSGNIAGLVAPKNPITKTKQIFGSEFAQYVKTELDLRYYRKMGLNSVFANRIITGVGVPYGNSKELPFIKQFFVGGTNSIRAFRSRSLGPGSYQVPDTTDFLPDQSGDIKLELNTEFRMKLYSVINGAVFVDAGNIWLFRSNALKPGAKFSRNFMSELAVGTGLGLRFDFNFFVLRLDLAFPLRKPYLPKGERWVFKDIEIWDSQWRKENLILNLGIGYPF